MIRDEGIMGVLAFQDRRELETLGQLHRHVFQGVNRQMRLPHFERGFQLLDEQPFATDLGQRPIEDLVTLGGHAQQTHLQPELLFEPCLDMLGLPQRQTAFARGDDHGWLDFGLIHAPMLAAGRCTQETDRVTVR